MTTLMFVPPAAVSGRRWGWGISLLVHAGLLGWLLQARAPLPPPVNETRIEIVLVPPRAADTPAVARAIAPAAVPERQAAPAPLKARLARREAPAAPPKAATEPASTPAAHTPAASAPATTAIAVEAPSATDAAPAAVAPPTPAAEDESAAARVDNAAAPHFDMAAARRAARQAGKQDNNLVALPEHKPTTVLEREREQKTQQAMERARRNDCRTAYAGLSLLAVIPLVIDTVRDKGCKW